MSAWDTVTESFRGTLFRKYFLALFTAVIVPLSLNGALEAWFGYREQRAQLNELLGAEARSGALRIQGFINGIRDQLGWTVQLPIDAAGGERSRFDALRLLRQVPAIVSLTLIDAHDKEQLYVSRVALNRFRLGTDFAGELSVSGARSGKIWYGPVFYYRGSEPFMQVSLAGNRANAGVAIAEVNLKAVWDVVSVIRIGVSGNAYVLDEPGRLIAHPDMSLVLQGTDDASARPLRELRNAVREANGKAIIGLDASGTRVMAAMAHVPGVDWAVVVKQPLTEAMGPIYSALWRTAGLLLLGALFAVGTALWLARRITDPIGVLAEGTRRVGAGQFDHRIEIQSGDELGQLADRFNAMASELKLGQDRTERINRLRRFLAPQVAELVDRVGENTMLASQRADVAAIFGDLRGFTGFAARTEPEEVMTVLGAYYAAIGAVVDRHRAALTSVSGDGIMILVNAPVAQADPATRALDLAADLQRAVQALVTQWRLRGHVIGFGVGMAFGPATVGQIDTGSRLDYTAIGPTVNLASRLCGEASDGQILLDESTATHLQPNARIRPLGEQYLKGFERPVSILTAQYERSTVGAPVSADQI